MPRIRIQAYLPESGVEKTLLDTKNNSVRGNELCARWLVFGYLQCPNPGQAELDELETASAHEKLVFNHQTYNEGTDVMLDEVCTMLRVEVKNLQRDLKLRYWLKKGYEVEQSGNIDINMSRRAAIQTATSPVPTPRTSSEDVNKKHKASVSKISGLM